MIRLARNELFNGLGDRRDVPNYAVLITDGLPNQDTEHMIPEAINAKIDGIHVVLVTIGSGLNKVSVETRSGHLGYHYCWLPMSLVLD